MDRLLAIIAVLALLAACAQNPPLKTGCHVESGWLDATNGCSARAGYPDCYQVCPDGSRVKVGSSSSNPQEATKP
jgi:hypothetical protein